MAGLPLTMVDGDCEFVHASLNRPEEWTYLVPRSTPRTLQAADAPNLFRRTHTCAVYLASQLERRIKLLWEAEGRIELPADGKILINVGSVGQPRDLCRDACYAVYDPQLQLSRVPANRLRRTQRQSGKFAGQTSGLCGAAPLAR